MRSRTVMIPVVEIIDGGTKSEFYGDLRNSLDVARRAANKAVSLCVAADSGLMSGGKCPRLYTYPSVSIDFPGAASIAASICRSVENKYRQERWHVARGRKSICNYRSMPWVLLCNKSNRTLLVNDAGEYLTARIKLLGGWWTVRLAGGSGHRHQVQRIREAMDVGKICDSKIWTDRKQKATLGLSLSLPDVKRERRSGALKVETTAEFLFVATAQTSETPLVITGDEAKRWEAERDRKYRRIRLDQRNGTPRGQLRGVFRRNGDKWRRRMDSFTHEVAAKIVAYANRHRVATVRLDMTVKSFMESFPWHELATKLAYKCEDAGIEFVNATQTIPQPDVSKPHVYFKYAPATGCVKIGRTGRIDEPHRSAQTDAPEEMVVLAVDNQPKSKLTQREKHFQAMFADARREDEWFDGERVIHFLREARWLGNAGNLSQIAQVLPIEEFRLETPSSRASVDVPEQERKPGHSRKADNSPGYPFFETAAPEVTENVTGH